MLVEIASMKGLIVKLNSLKQVKPESAWKQETRDVLLAQISNAVDKEVKVSGLEEMSYNLKNYFSFLPTTAWAIICLAIILAGGSMSALAIKNSKPGDTLYFAKAWKEQIQLAVTFNQEDKAKLGMKLASIHAEEIAAELSDPNFNVSGNQKKAEQLAQNFQQDINMVKENYSQISQLQNNPSSAGSGQVADNTKSNSAINNDDNAPVGIGSLQKSTDSQVYGVESGKETKGLQFYDPSGEAKSSTSTVKASSSPLVPLKVSSNSVSSLATSTAVSSSTAAADLNFSLDKAAKAADTNDYSAAKDIMNQVIAHINSGAGTVKGASEAGTSTGGDAATVGSSSGK